MGATSFYAGQPYNQDAWGHKAYDEFIEQFFFTGMLGQGENAIIEHITELTKNNKGVAGAWLHLIADVHGGGVFGDNTLDGRFRELESSWLRVGFDQIRNGMITKGRVDEQKSVIQTRKQFRKKMSRWLAETLEDQAVLTASGISYAFNTDGSPRVTPSGQDPWTALEYAADVSAPTKNRHVRWVKDTGFAAGDTTAVAATDLPTYAMIPELEALASTRRITPIRIDGEEYYVWLVHKNTMAKLWQDDAFRRIVTDAHTRGPNNPIFKGAKVTMNNLLIKPYNRTYNTLGAASGSKWGSSGTVNASRSLLLGAQALAMVDLGAVNWEEESKDMKARWALAIDKMVGWYKPTFKSSYTNTVEDFSTIAVDHAL